uniref:Uncharacterized protein n=1 Tax=Angiostrongylus cantonensis TaxID=6313 RepID=A0A158P6E5_ANGCA
MFGHIHYGPRLHCFKSTHHQTGFEDQKQGNGFTLPNTDLWDGVPNRTHQRNPFRDDRIGDESNENTNTVDNSISFVITENERSAVEQNTTSFESAYEKTRSAEMFGLLNEQLQHVKALSRLTSLSRFMLVRVLLNVHSTLEQMELKMKKTSEWVTKTILVIEQQVQSEIDSCLEQQEKVDAIISTAISSMSSIRDVLELVDQFLLRSEAWCNLKAIMELQSYGIERLFLDEFPVYLMNDYLVFNYPSNSDESVDEDSNKKNLLASDHRKLRLDSWTSASALSTTRSSCLSSSKVRNADVISEIMNSYDIDDVGETFSEPFSSTRLQNLSDACQGHTPKSTACNRSQFEEAKPKNPVEEFETIKTILNGTSLIHSFLCLLSNRIEYEEVLDPYY